MRIVSLVPSVTETLIDFGLADQIVGITRFCIHPADVVRNLPKVGGTKDPKLDRIRAAAPDVVFVNEEENRIEDYEALSQDLRVESTLIRRVDEVPDNLRAIGRICGVEAVAEERAQALDEGLEALAGFRAEHPLASFTYAYLIWRKPWMTLNSDTYVSDLLARAGGLNVYGDVSDRYPEITLKDLAARRPDVILLPDEPFPFRAAHADELAAAVPGPGIELIGGDDACWHGVRSIRGVTLAKNIGERWAKAQS